MLTDTPVKLSNGKSFLSGRVEVLNNGKWKNVCLIGSQNQDHHNAKVLCRTLGLSTRYDLVLIFICFD